MISELRSEYAISADGAAEEEAESEGEIRLLRYS